MSNITFQVIDQSCEAADQSFFPPRIALTTKSTTQIATVLGWVEFEEFASSPPKKFKTITWAGSSEQQLWYNGVQIGGARYDWTGTDQIDESGNIISQHTKNFSVMCNSSKNPTESPIQQLQDMQFNRANIVGPIYPPNTSFSFAASFVGYFGTNNVFLPPQCQIVPPELCPSASQPYVSVGNIGGAPPFVNPGEDLVGFWGSTPQTGQNSFVGTATVVAQSNTIADSSDSGNSTVSFNPYAIPLIQPGIILESFSQLQTPCGVVPRPPDWSASASVIFINNYSATLSGEYTDAEALANAHVIVGNSATAQNLPRTTGFISSFTNVVYTLSASNLIVGSDYVVSVDFWNTNTGVTTTNTIGFTASATTKVIISTVPTPPAGQSIQVRNPKISFA